MNIYFACSITGGRDYETVYQAITKSLLVDGHRVPTAHLAQSDVIQVEQVVDAAEVYARDVEWIRACDALIAEISVPSHGVVYEIGFALGLGKPVLGLYQNGRRVSKMITGNPHPALQVRRYEDEGEALEFIRQFLSGLKDIL